jgi:hypothetical protein
MVDKLLRISLRTVTLDIPPQDVITRDNVSIKVNAVVYFRVLDPNRAVVEVENYLYATSQLAQTTLRSVVGQVELDELLAQREKINIQLQDILDKHTEPWGIKVSLVETKQVDIPEEMRRAIARQAEAERERRASDPCGWRISAMKVGGRKCNRRESGSYPAQVPPDPDRGGYGEELDDDLPGADRSADALFEEVADPSRPMCESLRSRTGVLRPLLHLISCLTGAPNQSCSRSLEESALPLVKGSWQAAASGLHDRLQLSRFKLNLQGVSSICLNIFPGGQPMPPGQAHRP